MLTTREFFVKSYLEEEVIPFLDNLFKKSDPFKYELYQGNACRQYAVYGSLLLAELLPTFEWEVWEGRFSDIVHDQSVEYEHAWIYGKEKRGNRKFLIDLSRNHHQRLFILVPKNRYPQNHTSYRHMKNLWKKRVRWDEYMTDQEFYTGLETEKLHDLIKVECEFYDFLSELENFTLVEPDPSVLKNEKQPTE